MRLERSERKKLPYRFLHSQISVLGAIKESVLSGFCGTEFGLNLLPRVVIKLLQSMRRQDKVGGGRGYWSPQYQQWRRSE